MAVLNDDTGHPVEEADVVHKTGDKTQQEGAGHIPLSQGIKEGDQADPGNGPVSEFRE